MAGLRQGGQGGQGWEVAWWKSLSSHLSLSMPAPIFFSCLPPASLLRLCSVGYLSSSAFYRNLCEKIPSLPYACVLLCLYVYSIAYVPCYGMASKREQKAFSLSCITLSVSLISPSLYSDLSRKAGRDRGSVGWAGGGMAAGHVGGGNLCKLLPLGAWQLTWRRAGGGGCSCVKKPPVFYVSTISSKGRRGV